MSKETIQIPRKIANQLLHLAQTSSDIEVCGLIGSKHGQPCTCYPITNTAEHVQQSFQLDASEQIAAMVAMRHLDEDLFAIYHSHPRSPATPSYADLKQSAYPEALFLIISLNIKGVLEMRGFKINHNSAQEISLSLSA